MRFSDGHFNLRKWRTNHPELRREIEKQEGGTDGTEIGAKVLGIKWNEDEDVLIHEFGDALIEAEKEKITKRTILKVLASIYDPMGMIQPLVVTLKLLFQGLCSSGIGWDDVIGEEVKKKFHEVIN